MNLKTATVVLASLCLAWLVGCADVSSTGPTPPEFNSEFRFLNAAGDLGEVSISVDLGPGVSGLGFGAASSHQTYPSGNRVATLSNGDTLRIAMTSEQRATVMILPKTGETREFVKLIERRIFDSPTTATGKLRLVHAALTNGAPAADVDITAAGPDTTTVTVSYRGESGYLNLTPGSYALTVVASGDTTVLATSTITVGNSRSTSVVIGDTGSGLSMVNLEDN